MGVCVILSALLLASPAPEAEAAGKRVGCFKKAFPGPGDDPAFRDQPGKCIFIDRSALSLPVPPAFSTQSTQGVRWSKWGGSRAKGKGRGFVAVKKQPIAVRITLSRPVKRCGRRVYSKAKFRFPQFKIGNASFRLGTC